MASASSVACRSRRRSISLLQRHSPRTVSKWPFEAVGLYAISFTIELRPDLERANQSELPKSRFHKSNVGCCTRTHLRIILHVHLIEYITWPTQPSPAEALIPEFLLYCTRVFEATGGITDEYTGQIPRNADCKPASRFEQCSMAFLTGCMDACIAWYMSP